MNKQKNTKKGFDKYILYALVFLAPVFFLPFTLSAVPLSKQLFAGILLSGLLIYILVKFLAQGKILLPPFKISALAVGFMAAVLISAAFSQVRQVSFLGFSPDSFFWVAMYTIAFFAPILLLKDKKEFKNVSLAFIGGTGLLAVFSYLQLSEVFIFPWDFAQNIGFSPAGSVFAVGFLSAAALAGIVAYVSSDSASKKNKTILWTLAGFFALLILQINLRSIWISLAVAFIPVSFIAASATVRKKVPNLKLLLMPFLVIMLSLFFAVIAPRVPSFLAGTAEVGMPLDTTLEVTKDSLSGARWIWGTGPGTFSYNYTLHRPAELNQTNFWGLQFGQGYSAITSYAGTWGILGVAAFLAFLMIIFAKVVRALVKLSDNAEEGSTIFYSTAAGAVAAAGVLAASLFLYRGNALMHLFLFASLGTAVAALAKIKAFKRFRIDVMKNPQIMIVSSLLALAIISVAFGSMYMLGQKYMGQVYLAEAVDIYSTDQDVDRTLERLQKALDTSPSDDSILRTTAQAFILKMSELASDEDLQEQGATEELSSTFRSAVSAARQATAINSKDLQNWMQLGSVWQNAIGLAEGAENQAIEAYSEARKLAPNDPSLPLAQARVYMGAADIIQTQLGALAQSGQGGAQQEKQLAERRIELLNNSIEKVNESLELKQDYASARLLLASAYQRLGELDKAIEETSSLVRLSPNDPNLVFQLGLLYWQDEDYESAGAQLERAVTLADGEFANARYYLGLAYFELGERSDAIGQFEILSADNPENQLVTSILDNLKEGRDPFEQVQQPEASAPIEEGAPPVEEGADEPPVLGQ